MKNECRCAAEKVKNIAVAEYDKNNHQLKVFRIEVCENCLKLYDELGLILTEEQIKKYFG